ncbi:putative B3 domain-containing protein At2g27410 [Durio zibethinus]|uniref:B3 domain-containing protein At2g27410 n=1 Tax=Durio zibethinus TaxID=66656 RepID=A0A6P5Z5R8_DURZI|nr:putative B3 domain-containing protein At2g27410 [Durio zibethinus]
MLTLKGLENVDDGDSWKKLKKEVEAVTDDESQRLSKLTEIVLEGFIKRLAKEHATGNKKKMIIETKGIKRCPGSGSRSSFQEENEEYMIRTQKKQKTGNNDNMEKKQKTNKNNEKKQNQKKRPDPIVAELTALGLEPPPDMPEAFKNCIENLGGTEIMLVIQKFIQVSDLDPRENRLSMTENQVISKFLSEAEDERLGKKQSIEAVFVEPCLEVSMLRLTKWRIGAGWSYVFKSQWGKIVKKNADSLKPKAVVQVWSFRIEPESKVGFAMIKVRDGEDGHVIN